MSGKRKFYAGERFSGSRASADFGLACEGSAHDGCELLAPVAAPSMNCRRSLKMSEVLCMPFCELEIEFMIVYKFDVSTMKFALWWEPNADTPVLVHGARYRLTASGGKH